MRQISKYPHFCAVEETATQDRLRKLCPVLDYMLKAFDSAHSSEENLAVDEGLLKIRGRLPHVQFNPSKTLQALQVF